MALSTVTTTLKGLAAITLASVLTLGASSPAFADDSPIPDDATEYGSAIVEDSPTGGSGIRPAWFSHGQCRRRNLELRHELESCLL